MKSWNEMNFRLENRASKRKPQTARDLKAVSAVWKKSDASRYLPNLIYSALQSIEKVSKNTHAYKYNFFSEAPLPSETRTPAPRVGQVPLEFFFVAHEL